MKNMMRETCLVDIYSLNEKETDAIRLDASTIKQLYEDTDYKLKDIRKNKLVKPVALDSFPLEIKMIENVKKRKEFFIQIVLAVNTYRRITISELDRNRLFNIINKSKNTDLRKKMAGRKNINNMESLQEICLHLKLGWTKYQYP